MKMKSECFISLLIFVVALIFSDISFAKELKFRTVWILNDQYAGEIYSFDKEWYAQKGIELKFQPYDQSDYILPYEAVMNGSSDIGAVSISVLIKKIIPNPSDIIIFAAEYQISPSGFLVLENSGIKQIQDLENKVFGYFDDDNIEILRVFAKSHGLNLGTITYKKVSKSQLDMLINKEIDFFIAHETNAPLVLKEMGYKVRMFPLTELQKYQYGSAFFCRRDFYEKNRELLKSFLEITQKGWQAAFKNTKEAANIVMKYHPTKHYVMNDYDKTFSRIVKAIKMRNYYLTYNVGPNCIGCMSKAYWVNILDNYSDYLTDNMKKMILNKVVSFSLVDELIKQNNNFTSYEN